MLLQIYKYVYIRRFLVLTSDIPFVAAIVPVDNGTIQPKCYPANIY